jgi:hypothetical protein
MGNCYNEELRETIRQQAVQSQVLETILKRPQNDEELAILREKVAVAQQIEEIKELMTLRNELDMVKNTL